MSAVKTPRVSIIIPTLNEEQCLPKLLASIADQTTPPDEVIVVDGGSKDQTVAEAKKWIKRIPYLRVIETEAGLPLQRNRGAQQAHGDWLIFIDADSILLPYFMTRIHWFIQSYRPAFFTTWFRSDSETRPDAQIALTLNMVYEATHQVKHPVSPGPLTCVKRSVFDAAGGYDETLSWGEDYDLSKRICDTGVVLDILRETLYVYSLRRFRTERKVRLLRMYARIIPTILFTGNVPKRVPGYIMGGQRYRELEENRKTRTVQLKRFESRLKQLIHELFD